jgi:TPP-dependent pyruvate/acetoin dehydrogenase alpha subunit
MTKEELVNFEKQVAEIYEQGKISAPVHLNGGAEYQLIEIFRDIKREDKVLCTWRNHQHALLHGVSREEVMRQILAGRSMCMNSVDPWFYTSSIAGGILPIAVGLGMAIKRKGEGRRVFVFLGDMVSHSGIFHEAHTYAFNFGLPVTFIIEDNGKSVQTPTREAWGFDRVDTASIELGRILRDRNTIYYRYELTYPHHGVGRFVSF